MLLSGTEMEIVWNAMNIKGDISVDIVNNI
jgi:hypothetical protein